MMTAPSVTLAASLSDREWKSNEDCKPPRDVLPYAGLSITVCVKLKSGIVTEGFFSYNAGTWYVVSPAGHWERSGLDDYVEGWCMK